MLMPATFACQTYDVRKPPAELHILCANACSFASIRRTRPLNVYTLQVIAEIKKEGSSWVSKYARGGAAPQPGAEPVGATQQINRCRGEERSCTYLHAPFCSLHTGLPCNLIQLSAHHGNSISDVFSTLICRHFAANGKRSPVDVLARLHAYKLVCYSS